MTNDLVRRLRNLVGQYIGDADIDDELQGAADRIEKLEEELHSCFHRIEKLQQALRAIIVHCEVPAPPNAEALKMFSRKALEGHK